MKGDQPFLLLRATPKPGIAEAFGKWFVEVHLGDARAIPGFARVLAGRTAGGAWLGIYMFESADVVQASLASPQAAYTRGTWERWTGDLDELSIEMYAALSPLPIYESMS